MAPWSITINIGAVEAGLIVSGIGGALTLVGRLVIGYLREIKTSSDKDRGDHLALVDKLLNVFTENTRTITINSKILEEMAKRIDDLEKAVQK